MTASFSLEVLKIMKIMSTLKFLYYCINVIKNFDKIRTIYFYAGPSQGLKIRGAHNTGRG